jgi:hypothetical protein
LGFILGNPPGSQTEHIVQFGANIRFVLVRFRTLFLTSIKAKTSSRKICAFICGKKMTNSQTFAALLSHRPLSVPQAWLTARNSTTIERELHPDWHGLCG